MPDEQRSSSTSTLTHSISTPLCERLGIAHPVIQAAMGGGLAPARLAVAVSNAGGLGTIGTVGTPKEWWIEQIAEASRDTTKPFAVNILMGQDYGQDGRDALVRVCLDHRVPAVLFGGGRGAEEFFPAFKQIGTFVLQQVGTIADARRAADAGADAVIVQGAEAGGHVLGRLSALPLVPQAAAAIAPIPVALAGGIADGRGVAAALALGAQAAVLGTRFLATAEAAIHPEYQQHLVDASSDDVIQTDVYDEEWPHQPANILGTPTITSWLDKVAREPSAKDASRAPVAEVAFGTNATQIRRFSTATATSRTTGDVEELVFYAGQCVGLVGAVKSAGDVVRDVVAEAAAVINALAAQVKEVAG